MQKDSYEVSQRWHKPYSKGLRNATRYSRPFVNLQRVEKRLNDRWRKKVMHYNR